MHELQRFQDPRLQRRSAADVSPLFAHPDHPLALYVWDPTEVEQASFGLRAVAALGDRQAGVVSQANVSGLCMFACNEAALVEPVDTLLAHFGPDHLRLTGPHVRFWPGKPMRWPVMAVVIRVPGHYGTRVRSDLIDRGARCVEAEHGSRATVIRAVAPQTRLLGYAGWLHALTGGLGEVEIELRGYDSAEAGGRSGADPDPDPGPWAA